MSHTHTWLQKYENSCRLDIKLPYSLSEFTYAIKLWKSVRCHCNILRKLTSQNGCNFYIFVFIIYCEGYRKFTWSFGGEIINGQAVCRDFLAIHSKSSGNCLFEKDLLVKDSCEVSVFQEMIV